ncbi:MAG: HAMP domain-containing histidine kinase [Clostridium sp.]|nr:HAMP domain-containing histidine kinase [Clostridium sp.]
MKLFADKNIKQFFLALSALLAFFTLLSQLTVKFLYGKASAPLLLLSLLTAGCLLAVCFLHFYRQNKILETAVSQITAYLDGNTSARIDCDKEGEMYRLFHSVNTLAAVLNAHASNELREKDFLKNTLSDISHQLKTPLAALNIYNGLLQEEAEELPAVKEFAALSEQELDRIETLVQSLLKITKLDAGSIVLEKNTENVGDMMNDVELHFAYRAKQERKNLILSGADNVYLVCDRDWLLEALNNIVKNALDHTAAEDSIHIKWRRLSSMVQIVISDNGSGIHPEDLLHIFKRFYRSRFSKDTQGVGLGLPIAKAIIEAHGGSIEVNSEPGNGTSFTINFQ